MNKKYLFGVIILNVFLSCKNNNGPKATIGYSDSNSVSSVGDGSIFFFQNYALKDSLEQRIINFGDTIAYKKLHEMYTAAGLPREFYYYSLMMADIYNYNRACFDASAVMYSKNKNGIHEKIATYYLLKSYEGNYERAKQKVQYTFGSNPIPSSKEYLSNLSLSDK